MHANTVLYLKCDGTNNSTTITDECGHTVTANGGACLKTATKKEGTASCYFPGSGYLEIADSADWDFADGNFTIHAWMYHNSISAWCDFIGQYAGGGDESWMLAWDTDRKPVFSYSTTGSNQYYDTSSSALPLDQWAHLAVVRNSTTIKIYINGTETASLSCGTHTIYNSSRVLRIGCRASTNNYYYNGYSDNIIIVKGTALWTTSFTPPVNETVTPPSFSGIASLRARHIFDRSIVDPTFTAASSLQVLFAGRVYPFMVSDSLNAIESSAHGLGKLISNPVLASTSSLLANKAMVFRVGDSIFAYDGSAGGWFRIITESQEFHDFTYYRLTIAIYDYIYLQVSESNKHNLNALCLDEIILETASVVKYIIKTITEEIINSDDAHADVGRILLDMISFIESISNNLAITTTTTELLDTTDLITWAWYLQASDSLATTESVMAIPLMYALASENLAISESVSSVNRISFALAENNVVTDLALSNAQFSNIIQDNIGFIIRITLENETYQCWVLNTNELYPSCYSNFAFNSYAELESTTYAADETGICKLTGTTDNGTEIETGLRLNIFNTGIQKGKRFDNARFGISGTNLAIKVTTENDSIKYYVLDGRCKIARGQHGREWVFELANAEHIDFIELYPAILSR